MTLETFLLLLMIVSVMTGLFTEAFKTWLKERDKAYYPNALAGWTSVVVSLLIGAGYIILTETAVNTKMAVILIALILLSWLAAMVGYDKVIQAISQFKSYNK